METVKLSVHKQNLFWLTLFKASRIWVQPGKKVRFYDRGKTLETD